MTSALPTEGYVVTAPLVLLDHSGRVGDAPRADAEERELYAGAVVPLARVSEEWLKRHVEAGLIKPRFVFGTTL